jgi:hypothetical protein
MLPGHHATQKRPRRASKVPTEEDLIMRKSRPLAAGNSSGNILPQERQIPQRHKQEEAPA